VICKWGEEAYEKVEYRRKWESLNRRIMTHPKKKGNEDRKKRKNHFVLSNASEPVMPQEPNKIQMSKKGKEKRKKGKIIFIDKTLFEGKITSSYHTYPLSVTELAKTYVLVD